MWVTLSLNHFYMWAFTLPQPPLLRFVRDPAWLSQLKRWRWIATLIRVASPTPLRPGTLMISTQCSVTQAGLDCHHLIRSQEKVSTCKELHSGGFKSQTNLQSVKEKIWKACRWWLSAWTPKSLRPQHPQHCTWLNWLQVSCTSAHNVPITSATSRASAGLLGERRSW